MTILDGSLGLSNHAMEMKTVTWIGTTPHRLLSDRQEVDVDQCRPSKIEFAPFRYAR